MTTVLSTNIQRDKYEHVKYIEPCNSQYFKLFPNITFSMFIKENDLIHFLSFPNFLVFPKY